MHSYITFAQIVRDTRKIFSIIAKLESENSKQGVCYKYGEYPAYGPPTPSRLISLIGTDREMFLKGRRCEIQGLGVGAFVYYRRVVENQKERIIGKIVEVAKLLNAPASMIATLESAQSETQFTNALASVKDAIPESLRIRGQNPLTLLHSALSEGLHGRDDEACLDMAHAVRVVLVELSDRIGQQLKDTQELNNAVSFLMKKNQPIPPTKK